MALPCKYKKIKFSSDSNQNRGSFKKESLLSLAQKQEKAKATTYKLKRGQEKGNWADFRIMSIKRDELKLVNVKAGMASSTWSYELHQIGSGAVDRNMDPSQTDEAGLC